MATALNASYAPSGVLRLVIERLAPRPAEPDAGIVQAVVANAVVIALGVRILAQVLTG